LFLAAELWSRLSSYNNKINTLFEKLTEKCHSDSEAYWSTLDTLKDYPVKEVIFWLLINS